VGSELRPVTKMFVWKLSINANANILWAERVQRAHDTVLDSKMIYG